MSKKVSKKEKKKQSKRNINVKNSKEISNAESKYIKKEANDNNLKEKRFKKHNKILNIVIVVLIIILILISVFIGYTFYVRSDIAKNIKDKIVIEYGKDITLNDILKKNSYKKVKVSPNLKSLKKIGKHKVTLTIDDQKFEVIVTIKDTTPPTLEVKDLEVYIDEEMPRAKDFVVKVDDLSKVSLQKIEIQKTVGEQTVSIIAKDKYGNQTKKEAKLTIKEDKEPPTFSGLSNLSVYTGSKPDLNKGVEAVDERFGSVEFSIDDSKVDYNTPGNYVIYYTAADTLGNSTTQERKITIKQRDITYMINNFPTYSQFPNYPNGCESVALYTLLKYYNVNVSPEDIVNRLKKGKGPYWENDVLYGGNPEIEFVGDPRAKNGYGVFQKPIIDVANQYKSGMIDYTGHSLTQVLELVKGGIPVQVWVSINLKNTSVCTSWIYKETGQKINWICNLHSVVIVGFNSKYVYVSDPYNGKIVKYGRSQFQKMYNLFGKRAIYYRS